MDTNVVDMLIVVVVLLVAEVLPAVQVFNVVVVLNTAATEVVTMATLVVNAARVATVVNSINPTTVQLKARLADTAVSSTTLFVVVVNGNANLLLIQSS